MTTARRLTARGRVQGVFYRDWTVETAAALGLAGWVRNLPDGTVEGPQAAVDRMIAAMHDGPPRAAPRCASFRPNLRKARRPRPPRPGTKRSWGKTPRHGRNEQRGREPPFLFQAGNTETQAPSRPQNERGMGPNFSDPNHNPATLSAHRPTRKRLSGLQQESDR